MHKKLRTVSLTLITLAGALLILTGCVGAENAAPTPVMAIVTLAATRPPQALAAQPTMTAGALAFGPTPIPATPADDTKHASDAAPAQNQPKRVILKNATLLLTVDNPAASVRQITQLAEGIGGWVVNSNMVATVRDGQPITQAVLSIRVPADKLSSVLEQIKAGSTAVNSETITGDDVTAQYVDLSSHLANLEATEAQLQKIMTTATNIQDVLQVQDQLTTVQGQIEEIKGQLKYFSEAAAFSLINLTLNPKPLPATPTPIPTITPTPTVTPIPTLRPAGIANWKADDVATAALNSLVGLAQVLSSILIWLVFFALPVGIPILIIILIVRWLRRKSAAPNIPPAEK